MAHADADPDRDATLLLKKNGLYHDAAVSFDLNRGKLWLHLDDGDTLCIEAPRLRSLVCRYDQQLAASGLPAITDDGYAR